MTLQSISTAAKKAGPGFDDALSGAADIKSVITELQGYKIAVVDTCPGTGDCSAITGMTAADTIKSVLKYKANDSISDVTSHYTAAAGGMTCGSKADSDGTDLVVLWVDASGA